MKQRIQAAILSLLAVAIFIFTIVFLGTDWFKSPLLHEMIQLNEGWTVSHGENIYHPDVLSETVMSVANMDDRITMTSILPDAGFVPAVLHFRSILSTVDVYIDGYLIYTFGHDYEAAGRMLPKFHHFVTLPDDYAGKEVKIVLVAKENNAFSGLAPVVLGNEEDISRSVAQSGRLSLAIGVFLVMLGFILIILSPFFIFTGAHDASIVFSGIVSMLLGLYILCFNDLFWLMSDQPAFYTFLEYISLFSMPAAVLGFLTTAKQLRQRTIILTFVIIDAGFILITTVLHLTNLVHICHFVTWLHIICIGEGIFAIVSLLINDYKIRKIANEFSPGNRSTAILLLGLILFMGCSIIDIVKFNFLKFLSIGEVNTDISFMTVGAFFFILCLVLNYFYHCIEFISQTNMKVELEGLAYNDTLTTLSNRSKCELVLAELQGDYTIVSIDLDHLKHTNDNYGHTEGDRLIGGFANILKNSFTDASLIGRMGGDEFIVILPYIDDKRTNRDLDCLNDLMDYRNTIDLPLKYSCSYGYASSRDKELEHNVSAQRVYLLADTRMYMMKKEHHNQSLERLYNALVNTKNSGGDQNA